MNTRVAVFELLDVGKPAAVTKMTNTEIRRRRPQKQPITGNPKGFQTKYHPNESYAR